MIYSNVQAKVVEETRVDKEHIKELTALLNGATQKLKDSRDHYDSNLATLQNQLQEYQAAMDVQRKENE